MEIRFAIPEDVPGILALLRQEAQLHYRGRPDIFRSNAQKYGPSQVLAKLDKSDTPVFVAVEEKNVLGFCFCQIITHYQDSLLVDHTVCHIEDMCVEESHRRQHIGTALYDTVCRYAKQRKCRAVTLDVWSCNEDALKFYDSLGLMPQKLGMEAVLEDS